MSYTSTPPAPQQRTSADGLVMGNTMVLNSSGNLNPIALANEIAGGLHFVEYFQYLTENSARGVSIGRRRVGMLAYVWKNAIFTPEGVYDRDEELNSFYVLRSLQPDGTAPVWEKWVGGQSTLTPDRVFSVDTIAQRDALLENTTLDPALGMGDIIIVADASGDTNETGITGGATYIYSGATWVRFLYPADPDRHARNNDSQLVFYDQDNVPHLVTASQLYTLLQQPFIQLNDAVDATSAESFTTVSSQKLFSLLSQYHKLETTGDGTLFLADDGTYRLPPAAVRPYAPGAWALHEIAIAGTALWQAQQSIADSQITPTQNNAWWTKVAEWSTPDHGHTIADIADLPDTLAAKADLENGKVKASQLPDIDWAGVKDTPTTLTGYGITDSYTKDEADAKFLQVTGEMIAGAVPVVQADGTVQWGNILAQVVTHETLVSSAASATLVPGAYYIYLYWAVYTDNMTGVLITKDSTAEMLLVQATTSSTLSRIAISDEFPTDIINIDILDTTKGGPGWIVKRTDKDNNEAPFDWRNITFKRAMVTGLSSTVGTLTGSTFAATIGKTIYVDRYQEYYLTLPTTHPASPQLSLTRNTTTYTRALVDVNGVALGANALATMNANGLYLVMYSKSLDAYMITSAQTEHDMVKGYLSWTSSSTLSLGYGSVLTVNGSDIIEAYAFGERNTKLINTKLGPRTGMTLPNIVVLYDTTVSRTRADISILPGSYNGTLNLKDHGVNSFRGAVQTSIISGGVNQIELGIGGVISSLICSNAWGDGILKGKTELGRFSNLYQFTGFFSSHWLGTKFEYGEVRGGLIRQYLGALEFNVSINEVINGTINANKNWDKVSFQTLQSKTYEYGSQRRYYNQKGWDFSLATYRDTVTSTTEIVGKQILPTTPTQLASTTYVLARDSSTGELKEVAVSSVTSGVETISNGTAY